MYEHNTEALKYKSLPTVNQIRRVEIYINSSLSGECENVAHANSLAGTGGFNIVLLLVGLKNTKVMF